MNMTISLTTEHIPLSSALKLAGAVASGGEAKQFIQAGMVHLNGQPDTRRSAKVRPGDTIVLNVKPLIRISVVAD
jgi:ribosome-associated protein